MDRPRQGAAGPSADKDGVLGQLRTRLERAFEGPPPMKYLLTLDSLTAAAPASKTYQPGVVSAALRLLCAFDPAAEVAGGPRDELAAYYITCSGSTKEAVLGELTKRCSTVLKAVVVSWTTLHAAKPGGAAAAAVTPRASSCADGIGIDARAVRAWREDGCPPALSESPVPSPSASVAGRKRQRSASVSEDAAAAAVTASPAASIATPRRARRRLNDGTALGVPHSQDDSSGSGGGRGPLAYDRSLTWTMLRSIETPFPRTAAGALPAIVAAFPGIPIRRPLGVDGRARGAAATRSGEDEDDDDTEVDDPGAASGAWCALLAAEEALTEWYTNVQAAAAAAAEGGGAGAAPSRPPQPLTTQKLRLVTEAAGQTRSDVKTKLVSALTEVNTSAAAVADAAPTVTATGARRAPLVDSWAVQGDAPTQDFKGLLSFKAFMGYIKHRTGGAAPEAAARRASGGSGDDGSSGGAASERDAADPIGDGADDQPGNETPLLMQAWRTYKSVATLPTATQLQLEALSKARSLRSYAVQQPEARDDQDPALLPALLGAHFPRSGRASPAAGARPAAPAPSGEVADPLALFPLTLSDCIVAGGAYEAGAPVVPPAARYSLLSKDRVLQVARNADAIGAAVARGRTPPPLPPWLSAPSQGRLFEACVWACRFWNAVGYHVPARVVEATLAELTAAAPHQQQQQQQLHSSAAGGEAHIPAYWFTSPDCRFDADDVKTSGDPSAGGSGSSSSSSGGAASEGPPPLLLPDTGVAYVPHPQTALYLLSRLVARAATGPSAQRRLLAQAAPAADARALASLSSRGPAPAALARAAPRANALCKELLEAYPWLATDPGTFRLRLAVEADCGAILRLVKELATFEGQDTVGNTVETLQRDGFGPEPCFYVILVEVPSYVRRRLAMAHAAAAAGGGGLLRDVLLPGALREGDFHNVYVNNGEADAYDTIGMAFMHPSYSTWEGRTLYVEDLYVTPAFRRYGLGSLLVRAAATVARVSGCQRLQWSCLDWNNGAMALYRSPAIAAAQLSDWRLFRLESDGLSHASGLGHVTGVAEGGAAWPLPQYAEAGAAAVAVPATSGEAPASGARQSLPAARRRGPRRGPDLAIAFQGVVADPLLFPAAAAVAGRIASTEVAQRSPPRPPAWDAGSQSGDSAAEDDADLAHGALLRFSGGTWRDPFTPPSDMLQSLGDESAWESSYESTNDDTADGIGEGDDQQHGGSQDRGDVVMARLQEGVEQEVGQRVQDWARLLGEVNGAGGGAGARGGPSARARRQLDAAAAAAPAPAAVGPEAHHKKPEQSPWMTLFPKRGGEAQGSDPQGRGASGEAAAAASSGGAGAAAPRQHGQQGALSALKNTLTGLSSLAGLKQTGQRSRRQ